MTDLSVMSLVLFTMRPRSSNGAPPPDMRRSSRCHHRQRNGTQRGSRRSGLAALLSCGRLTRIVTAQPLHHAPGEHRAEHDAAHDTERPQARLRERDDDEDRSEDPVHGASITDDAPASSSPRKRGSIRNLIAGTPLSREAFFFDDSHARTPGAITMGTTPAQRRRRQQDGRPQLSRSDAEVRRVGARPQGDREGRRRRRERRARHRAAEEEAKRHAKEHDPEEVRKRNSARGCRPPPN